MKFRQLRDDIQSTVYVVVVGDTFVVEVEWYERLIEFAVPQFEQRRRYTRVRAAQLCHPRITLQLESVDSINVTWYPVTHGMNISSSLRTHNSVLS